MTERDELSEAFADALTKAARAASCARVLVVGWAPELAKKLKRDRDKVVFAVADSRLHAEVVEAGCTAVDVPRFRGSRTDRLKGALVAAMNAGLITAEQRLACAVLRDEDDSIDLLMHFTARDVAAEHQSVLVGQLKTHIPAPLLEVLVDLALRIGREGYEGRPVGTLIVVGDSTRVMEQSTPLSLNPFQGYSEDERNLFDPSVRSAVRTFAMLDGAFVVREDGVVLAAGRHIRVTAVGDVELGHGARHVAAAAVTLQTDALAIAVSQSSGRVRVFDKGRLVLELDPGGRRGIEPPPLRPGRPPRRNKARHLT